MLKERLNDLYDRLVTSQNYGVCCYCPRFDFRCTRCFLVRTEDGMATRGNTLFSDVTLSKLGCNVQYL